MISLTSALRDSSPALRSGPRPREGWRESSALPKMAGSFLAVGVGIANIGRQGGPADIQHARPGAPADIEHEAPQPVVKVRPEQDLRMSDAVNLVKDEGSNMVGVSLQGHRVFADGRARAVVIDRAPRKTMVGELDYYDTIGGARTGARRCTSRSALSASRTREPSGRFRRLPSPRLRLVPGRRNQPSRGAKSRGRPPLLDSTGTTSLADKSVRPGVTFSIIQPLSRGPCTVGVISNGGLEADDRRPCR
jgi:hypothetical protein